MKFYVVLNDREVDIDPADLSAVREVEPGVYSVLLKGATFEVRLAPEGAGFTASAAGFTFSTEVRDPRNMVRRAPTLFGAHHQEIRASMPGKVIRVLVQESAQVVPGQGLVVVEAMKMQNEMKAAKAGRVAHVRVKDGDTVAAGQVLLAIE